MCSLGNCQELVAKCQENEMCGTLFASWNEKCNDVITANFSSPPMCSDDCKQALDELTRNPYGSKLKCCDCGRLSIQELRSLHSLLPMPPIIPMPPTNHPRPNPRSPPTGDSNSRPTPPSSRPPPTRPPMPPITPPMPMMNFTPSYAMNCYVSRVKFEKHCNSTDDDCIDCKQSECLPCSSFSYNL